MSTDHSSTANELTPLRKEGNDSPTNSSDTSSKGEGVKEESILNKEADKLSKRLLACGDDDDMENAVLKNSFALNGEQQQQLMQKYEQELQKHRSPKRQGKLKGHEKTPLQWVVLMLSIAILGLIIILALLRIATYIVGPPPQPIGAYKLVELQEGDNFFRHYNFYSGPDSEGSNGYITYVSKTEATQLNLANVTYETVKKDLSGGDNMTINAHNQNHVTEKEAFIYMSTAPSAEGPRKSVRLEGLKRYSRGLFILDVRHMPAGCATWPAFWLTDEPNWPINGEIDILEGVNDQTVVKTALHTTMDCKMNDVPVGLKTGTWDTAQGVPQKNGTLDMRIVEADDCFVYDKHQWLNQGCVAVSDKDGTIGTPLNEKGGGVFALEWDPINTHIRSYAFTPHSTMPQNLKDALSTASERNPARRVEPDPRQWGLPYAYFPIGKGTECSANHFKNMHLIFNMALCGSVAGTRFAQDCPKLNEKYGSCDYYVGNNTAAMDEIYWKVRGVYVYEREWEKRWVN